MSCKQIKSHRVGSSVPIAIASRVRTAFALAVIVGNVFLITALYFCAVEKRQEIVSSVTILKSRFNLLKTGRLKIGANFV